MAKRISKGARRLADWIGTRTQAEAAGLLVMPPESLNRWLRGYRLPSLERAFELEDVTHGMVPARAWLER